jgi:hypothetical protein
VRSFLYAKGIRDSDPVAHYKRPTRGFGIIPAKCCKGRCSGYNELSVGDSHFVITSVTGGGMEIKPGTQNCLVSSTQFAGQISVVNWVRVHHQGKSCWRLSLAVLGSVLWCAVGASVLALALPKCHDVDVCTEVYTMPEHAGLAATIDAELRGSGRCEPACSFRNCSSLVSDCARPAPACFTRHDGVCNVPWTCPNGSDVADCSATQPPPGAGRRRAQQLQQERAVAVASDALAAGGGAAAATAAATQEALAAGLDVAAANAAGVEAAAVALARNAAAASLRAGTNLAQAAIDAKNAALSAGVDAATAVSISARAAADASGSFAQSMLNQLPNPTEMCQYAGDGVCDEPLRCTPLTDTRDCDAAKRDAGLMQAYLSYLRGLSPTLASLCDALADAYEPACVYMTPPARCAGCATVTAGAMVSSHRCAPGDPSYPTGLGLCHVLQRAKRLHEAKEWCPADYWESSSRWYHLTRELRPCDCLSWEENLIPDGIVILKLWVLGSMVCVAGFVAVWWKVNRVKVELGVVGAAKDSLTVCRIDRHHAGEVPFKLLDAKLGREARRAVLRTWERVWMGTQTRLTLHRDYLRLEATDARPFVCEQCRRTHVHDEYYTLLRDIHFIESGTETSVGMRRLAKVFLFCGLAFALSVFFESFLRQWQAKSDISDDELRFQRWMALGIGVGCFITFYFLAGTCKRDHLHVGVFPGEEDRGHSNTFGGNSPFFITMGLQCTNAENKLEPFDDLVKMVRSAARESRSLDQSEHVAASMGVKGGDQGGKRHLPLPPHLAHLEHHPLGTFHAIKWALRLRHKAGAKHWGKPFAEIDRGGLGVIFEQEEQDGGEEEEEEEMGGGEAVADTFISSHADELLRPHEERAVRHWLYAKDHLALARQVDDVDTILTEIMTQVEHEEVLDAAEKGALDGEHIKGWLRAKAAVLRQLHKSDDPGPGEGLGEGGITDAAQHSKASSTAWNVALVDARTRMAMKHRAAYERKKAHKLGVHGKLYDARKQIVELIFHAKAVKSPSKLPQGRADLGAGEEATAEMDMRISELHRQLGDKALDELHEHALQAGVDAGALAAAVAPSKQLQRVDELFHGIQVAHAKLLISGTLQKMGGRRGRLWESRRFELSKKGLTWTPIKPTSGLSVSHIESVDTAEDIGGAPTLVVRSKEKHNKEYKLIAPTIEERDAWVTSIQAMLDGNLPGTVQGRMLKLGGWGKDEWEERIFTCSSKSFEWSASVDSKKTLTPFQIISVQCSETLSSDDGAGAGQLHEFELLTTVKGGKIYQLRAHSEQERSAWVDEIEGVIGEMKILKRGQLDKLGGAGQNHWEPRRFELTSKGLQWTTLKAEAGLQPKDITSVRPVHDVGCVAVRVLKVRDVAPSVTRPALRLSCQGKTHTVKLTAEADSPGSFLASGEKDILAIGQQLLQTGRHSKGDECLFNGVSMDKGDGKQLVLELLDRSAPEGSQLLGSVAFSLHELSVADATASWRDLLPAASNDLPPVGAVSMACSSTGSASFVVVSRVKGGKSYHLIASTVAERDEWVAAVQQLVDAASADAVASSQLRQSMFTTSAVTAAADTVELKYGKLLKLGGRQRATWEERAFIVGPHGFNWRAGGKGKSIITPDSIINVASTSGTPHGFAVSTSVKDGKTYHFKAGDDDERDAWIAALRAVQEAGTMGERKKINLDLRVVNNDGKHRVEFKEANLKLDFEADKDQLLDQDKLLELALAECFATFDTDKTGRLQLFDLQEALDTLGLQPTEDELAWMVSEYAVSEDGSVSQLEFVHMMRQYIDAGSHPQLEYTGASWCPLSFFSLDFDFLPWGKRHTEFKAAAIEVKAQEGLFGALSGANQNNTSMETEKTRWLHMEGNPTPAWKLNAYLAEALAVFTLSTGMGGNVHACIVGAGGFFIFRVLYFMLRRRGMGQLYAFGNPPPTGRTDGQGRFAVPLNMMKATIDAFLHLKGISATDLTTDYVKVFPGMGICPVCCGCYAEHTLSFGEKHFQMTR